MSAETSSYRIEQTDYEGTGTEGTDNISACQVCLTASRKRPTLNASAAAKSCVRCKYNIFALTINLIFAAERQNS